MFPSESTRVLEALNVLCEAPRDLILPHPTELRATAQKLQSLINDPITTIVPAASYDRPPPTAGDVGQLPLSSDSHCSFPTPREDLLGPSPAQRPYPQPPPQEHRLSPAPLNSIEQFVEKLKGRLEKIEEYVSEVGHDAVKHEPDWRKGDPRLVDLQIGGTRTTTPITKLRRGLSMRSLAIEFDDWESKTYKTSTIRARTDSPSKEPSRKLGNITAFLKAKKDRFYDSPSLSKGIEHGMKMLVCEKLLGGMGFSAIFVFRYSGLRKVKYEELNTLRDLILSSEPIKKFAEQKANWFDHCQRDYNTWALCTDVTNPLQLRQTNGLKRRRLNRSSSRYKRLEPRKPHSSNQLMNMVARNTEAGMEALDRAGTCAQPTQSVPLGISNIPAKPFQQIQSLQDGQGQQSPASRHPSLQNLIHTSPLSSFGHDASTGRYDGMHKPSTHGVAMDGNTHQSFSHLNPASSSQRNPTNVGHGSLSGQYLPYMSQLRVPPNPQGEGNPHSNNVSAAEFSHPTTPEMHLCPTPPVDTGQKLGTEVIMRDLSNLEFSANDPSTFSDPINVDFWDPSAFSDPTNVNSWDPSVFSDTIDTSLMESFANDPSTCSYPINL